MKNKMLEELPMNFLKNVLNEIESMNDDDLYNEMMKYIGDDDHKGIASFILYRAELVKRGFYK